MIRRTRTARLPICLALALAAGGCADTTPVTVESPVVWRIDSLESIGGHEVRVLGEPSVAGSTDGSRSVEFDGLDDGLELPLHPLAGADAFTIEAIFRPRAGGEREQRFLHLQEDASKDRILLEIRLPSEARWFLDTYVKSRDEGYTLFAKGHEHPVGPWYHAALVVGGGRMRHYVNGQLELERAIDYAPQTAGRSSIGVRLNRVSWFKGAIREVRFTRRALDPDEFLPFGRERYDRADRARP